MTDILLVGPSGSGKTLFGKALQFYVANNRVWSFAELSSQVPTVGVNIFALKGLKGKKQSTLRELGGAISNMWPNYFTTSSQVVFLMDGSDPFNCPADCVLLHSCLFDSKLHNAEFLVVFTKSDAPSFAQRRQIVREITAIDRLKGGRRVTLVDNFSSLTGEGFSPVLAWLERFAQ